MTRSRLLKGAIGFAAGLALWIWAGPAYHGVVTRATGQLFHIVEHPNVTQLRPTQNAALLDRTDFDRRSPRPEIPIRDLTFNVILLLTLLAAAGPRLSLEQGWKWLAALGALFAVHVAALGTKVMALYVLRLGAWSRAHYGDVARNFWTGADHFYRFVGIYAAAFVIWWIVREGDEGEDAAPRPKPARKRGRKG